MTRRTMSLLMLTVMLVSAVPVSYAQTATATIVGDVIDPQGAVVANATVVARNVETGIERTTPCVFGFGLFGERDTNFPIIKADPVHPGFL